MESSKKNFSFELNQVSKRIDRNIENYYIQSTFITKILQLILKNDPDFDITNPKIM